MLKVFDSAAEGLQLLGIGPYKSVLVKAVALLLVPRINREPDSISLIMLARMDPT